MNKDFLLKFLVRFTTIFIVAIGVCGIVIAFMFDDVAIKGAGIGMSVGVIIGGVFKVKVILPKQLKGKDERALLIYLLSSLVGSTVFGIISCFYFLFSISEIFKFTPADMEYYISLLVLLILTFKGYYISKMYFEKYM